MENGEIHPKVKALLEATYFEQRSQEWLDLRENMLTASDAASALGANPYEKPDKLLMKKCGAHKWSGNAATAHGTLLEPVARDLYDAQFSKKTHELGLVVHPKYPFLGGSADGVTEDGILVEIKCPLKRKIEPKVPKHYVAQVQLLMEILDLEVCDFVQYKPDPYEFVTVRVARDRKWFEEALPVMEAFWNRVLEARKIGMCEIEPEAETVNEIVCGIEKE
jgi:putative phage-type endonuclease